MIAALLVASVLSATPAPRQDPSVGFLQSYELRSARLMPGVTLQSDVRLPTLPPLRALGALAFGTAHAPLRPLDSGSALRGESRQVLALLLGVIVGFGLGHLVAQDREGLILFLVVDIAIVIASVILDVAAGFHFFWLGLLVSHIIQGLDAYGEAGGQRLVERARERAVELASQATPTSPPPVTTRVFSLTF